jgi:hypothetical protein
MNFVHYPRFCLGAARLLLQQAGVYLGRADQIIMGWTGSAHYVPFNTLRHQVSDSYLSTLNTSFKHYFLVADDALQPKDVELAVLAFLEFQRQCPEFTSFRMIVAFVCDSNEVSSSKVSKDLIFRSANVVFVRCASNDELVQLLQYCYALVCVNVQSEANLMRWMASGKPLIVAHNNNEFPLAKGVLRPCFVNRDPRSIARWMVELVCNPDIAVGIGLAAYMAARCSEHNSTY